MHVEMNKINVNNNVACWHNSTCLWAPCSIFLTVHVSIKTDHLFFVFIGNNIVVGEHC